MRCPEFNLIDAIIIVVLVAIIVLLLAGCDEAKTGDFMTGNGEPVTESGRFSAAYQGTFRKANSTNDHGVFILTDHHTGKRFLVVEGCGVQDELTVDCGKNGSYQADQ